ncbi:MAG: hypothetical protein IPO66_11665 [Rhodanobacteraceae bacterium]|nr:hypothetical protein [Rhodanobacteraceae bacterium]
MIRSQKSSTLRRAAERQIEAFWLVAVQHHAAVAALHAAAHEHAEVAIVGGAEVIGGANLPGGDVALARFQPDQSGEPGFTGFGVVIGPAGVGEAGEQGAGAEQQCAGGQLLKHGTLP